LKQEDYGILWLNHFIARKMTVKIFKWAMTARPQLKTVLRDKTGLPGKFGNEEFYGGK